MTAARLTLLTFALLTLAGCDNIVAMMADPRVAQRIADAKAIGSACRYGLRSIEDCYALNEKASKASIFDGWKEMDQYMRDNKIDGIVSKGIKPALPAEEVIDEKASDDTAKDSKPKPKAKAADKATN
ncbi:MAG: hypothetical protein ABIZ09_18465 [Rhodoferax sp.]|jgi:hypothetical protein